MISSRRGKLCDFPFLEHDKEAKQVLVFMLLNNPYCRFANIVIKCILKNTLVVSTPWLYRIELSCIPQLICILEVEFPIKKITYLFENGAYGVSLGGVEVRIEWGLI